MPTIQRPRLLKADTLRSMNPRNLERLLSPFRAYFNSRDLILDGLCAGDFDFDRLAAILASARDNTPPRLVEQVDTLDLISNSQSLLNFETEYHDAVKLLHEEGDTEADLAVKLLLDYPEVASREYDRQALRADRALVSFRVREGMKFLGIDSSRIGRFKRAVAPWFAENARSAACIVHHHEETDGHAFVIRHGDLLKRVGVLVDDDGSQDSIVIRPERVDVAHYHTSTGEWQVSGLGSKIQELYRIAFGKVFHGSTNALVRSQRYSLSPLLEGPESIQCDPASTVQHAELQRVSITTPDGQRFIVEKGDVFQGMLALPGQVLQSSELREAVISLKLVNRSRRVRVRICPDRDVILGNHIDPAIDAWLLERGFASDERKFLASA